MTTWLTVTLANLSIVRLWAGRASLTRTLAFELHRIKTNKKAVARKCLCLRKTFKTSKARETREFWHRTTFFVAGMIMVLPKASPRRRIVYRRERDQGPGTIAHRAWLIVIQADNVPSCAAGHSPVGIQYGVRLLFIEPGKRLQNARSRIQCAIAQECLNEHVFVSMDDARNGVAMAHRIQSRTPAFELEH
jgi:hypothetical protein